MSYEITQNDNERTYGIKSAVVNTRADIETLPTKWTAGSDCLCIEDSSVWILTVGRDEGERMWKEI